MPHNPSERPHRWWCRIAFRQGDDMRMPMAKEGETIVRRAAGNVAGKTVAAQIRQAARNLGYPADSWRIREAWYGRAGCWSAQAMRQLQDAYLAWMDRESDRADAERLRQAAADRALLEEIRRKHLAEVAKIEARLAHLKGDDP